MSDVPLYTPHPAPYTLQRNGGGSGMSGVEGVCSGSEAGSYLRLIDFCVSPNSMLESNKEEEEGLKGVVAITLTNHADDSCLACETRWRI